MFGDADDEWLERALADYSVTRDPTTRDRIVDQTSWLAVRGAKRFSDRGEPFDDLLQVARIGLLKALERFDPSLGVPFAAYATPTIMGEIRRYFRDHTWSLHVPRRAKDLRAAVNRCSEELAGELGRSPRVAEIAQRLGTTDDAVLECLEANMVYKTRALDLPGHPDTAGVDRSYLAVLDREVVRGLLDRLPKRERTILELRFFEEMSQSDIAERVGTSQVHVGRLLTSSLTRLRAIMVAQNADPEFGTQGERP